MSTSLPDLLGLKPSSAQLRGYISSLASSTTNPDLAVPDVKSYSDVVYFNYYTLGLSLSFKPVNGYKPATGAIRDALRDESLVLDGLDVYNLPKPKANASRSKQTYATYPSLPVTLRLPPLPPSADTVPRTDILSIGAEMTGKEFVSSMGEPDRKGGGAGPSSGSIGIWCEWSKDGVMVEFGGDESRGPQAWERGKDAVWKVMSIFPAKAD